MAKYISEDYSDISKDYEEIVLHPQEDEISFFFHPKLSVLLMKVMP